MFINVSRAKLPKGLNYLWVPHLLIKPSCRKNMVLLDCYFSSTLSKDVVMILLSRSVRSVKIDTSSPLDCPVLFSSGCTPLYYQKVLNAVNISLMENCVENLVLKPQDARAKNVVIDIFKTILKLLCFPDLPREFNQVYVLLGLDVPGKRAYVVLGDRLVRSTILEEVLYGQLNGLSTIKPYL